MIWYPDATSAQGITSHWRLAIGLLGFTFMAGIDFAVFLTVLALLRNHGEETTFN